MFKRLTLTVGLCYAIALTALAQSSEPGSSAITLGVKAGANLYDTYQKGTKFFVSSPGAGFHAGVYGDYNLAFVSPGFSARLEALFSTRGLYLSEYTNDERIDYEREASYIDFPVSVNYKLWKNLSVHAGIVPSLFVEEYRSITKNAEGFKVDEGDQFRSYERWQFAGMAGASYTFEIMDQPLQAGARYSMAFTRTNELIRDVRASRDPKYMMLQVYLAYKLLQL